MRVKHFLPHPTFLVALIPKDIPGSFANFDFVVSSPSARPRSPGGLDNGADRLVGDANRMERPYHILATPWRQVRQIICVCFSAGDVARRRRWWCACFTPRLPGRPSTVRGGIRGPRRTCPRPNLFTLLTRARTALF